jgi:hypothetical protein
MSEHLDFNTDFLNNSTSSKKAKLGSRSGLSAPKDTSWKKNLAIILAVIFGVAILVAAADDPSTSYTAPSTATQPSAPEENSLVFNGQTFRCSSYNYDRAMTLRPNAALVAQLEAEGASLDASGG